MLTQFRKGTRSNNNSYKKEIADKGKRYSRTKSGQDVGISVSILQHSTGVVYRYENHSSRYTLKEDIEFDLRNCSIIGRRDSAVCMRVGPGHEKSLEIKSNGSRDWKATPTSWTYGVS